jgi:hypothetical protein
LVCLPVPARRQTPASAAPDAIVDAITQRGARGGDARCDGLEEVISPCLARERSRAGRGSRLRANMPPDSIGRRAGE